MTMRLLSGLDPRQFLRYLLGMLAGIALLAWGAGIGVRTDVAVIVSSAVVFAWLRYRHYREDVSDP